ncbi:MAG: diphthamide biosynthesis enzyme Dph2 [Candidatus Bathyarchaeota archaeon]|nr:diphthamide biosynthesis enzyme Dph2 [Candidatus Bathyarchaeota archaeon]
MSSSIFDLEERRIKREIQRRQPKLVSIQLPEGLKPCSWKLVKLVEKSGALAVVSANPCYGSCDLALVEAQILGADLIVHFGHSEILKQDKVPTIYIETRAKGHVKNIVKKAVPLLEPWRKIGLVTTIQHIHRLEEARQALAEAGKSVVIGNAGRLKYPGQVTGCDYSNAKTISKEVDSFLFVGGGRFHPLGVALATSKPTFVADPFQKRIIEITDEAKRMKKKRYASICDFRKAERIGIIIGLKPGQKSLDQALRLRKILEKSGRQIMLLALTEITPEALMQFPVIDAFINTACPRISLDDTERFLKPLLTHLETLVALGEIGWDELCRKGWFEN